MAEGVASAGGAVVAEGVYDNRDSPPPPDPVRAPKGWTWDRGEQHWKPRLRGPVLPQQGQQQDQPPAADAEDTGGGAGRQQQDPDPGWMRPGADQQPDGDQWSLTDTDRKDIKALIALAYTLPSEALPLLDPYCFEPLQEKDTAEGVISAVSDIVCGSPRVARWAASAAGLMPWIKLGIALKPIAIASLHHHVLRDVEVELDRENKTMLVTKRDWSMFKAG